MGARREPDPKARVSVWIFLKGVIPFHFRVVSFRSSNEILSSIQASVQSVQRKVTTRTT